MPPVGVTAGPVGNVRDGVEVVGVGVVEFAAVDVESVGAESGSESELEEDWDGSGMDGIEMIGMEETVDALDLGAEALDAKTVEWPVRSLFPNVLAFWIFKLEYSKVV